tara:strand:+ start:1085 stop:1249 length:165 start_codon:yes stop_codon:yes gene_type:complete
LADLAMVNGSTSVGILDKVMQSSKGLLLYQRYIELADFLLKMVKYMQKRRLQVA